MAQCANCGGVSGQAVSASCGSASFRHRPWRAARATGQPDVSIPSGPFRSWRTARQPLPHHRHVSKSGMGGLPRRRRPSRWRSNSARGGHAPWSALRAIPGEVRITPGVAPHARLRSGEMEPAFLDGIRRWRGSRLARATSAGRSHADSAPANRPERACCIAT